MVAFLENLKAKGALSTSSITKHPHLPSYTSPKNDFCSWMKQFRKWQHNCFLVISCHHIYPQSDSIYLHHCRIQWILRYCNCESRIIVMKSPKNAWCILDNEKDVVKHTEKMSLVVNRCECFKGCIRSCPYQKKGMETACNLCGCFYRIINMDPPLQLKNPPEDCKKK